MPNDHAVWIFSIQPISRALMFMFDLFTAENHVFVEKMLQQKCVIPIYSTEFCQSLQTDYIEIPLLVLSTLKTWILKI